MPRVRQPVTIALLTLLLIQPVERRTQKEHPHALARGAAHAVWQAPAAFCEHSVALNDRGFEEAGFRAVRNVQFRSDQLLGEC
jgi:hypothetical protein